MVEDKDKRHRRRLDGAGHEGSAGSAGASRSKREDDRNVDVDESPVPDPETKDPPAEDDPEAD
jgi:hypothetical protein